MLEVTKLDIPEVMLLKTRQFGDDRGWFSESYNKQRFADAGITHDFVQDNHSYSAEAGVLRGLHFQTGDFAQTKLVRVLRGSIFDVAVDIRHGSPTYGKWVSAIISAENFTQILVPRGFAHGLLTLEPDTEVMYKVDAHYDKASDMGIRWDDPDIGIDWPTTTPPQLSEKDTVHPGLAESDVHFTYDG